MTILTPERAAGFAYLTLGHIGREYPYKLDQMLTGPDDVVPPKVRHPIFHGSFDWHSCCHGWWQLLTIARLFPDLPEAAAIRARADDMLVPEKAAGEFASISRGYPGFGRPYSWGWLLALHGEASRHDAGWADALAPIARLFVDRMRDHLPRLTYPIRVGTHFNTSFALTHAHAWALVHDPDLATLITARAIDWFGGDRDCQAWEPGGDEFLSSALCEAGLMASLLDDAAYRHWFDDFLPRLASGEPATLFVPAIVSDRSDGKIAHLDGLNLSRGWCWRRIAAKLGPQHPSHSIMRGAAENHLAAALPHLGDDYMGEHWLASFALLALIEG
ncbi:DUF2891 domain-containing protein [Sphingomonas sp. MMS24-J13]|uniref:DUF2891 domain-containing protein n=1 Tax=Sphingomonas sp. MMS24-J13 TaxID=3238686 RepID=UPI00384CFBED